jgi:hypothetical protein
MSRIGGGFVSGYQGTALASPELLGTSDGYRQPLLIRKPWSY